MDQHFQDITKGLNETALLHPITPSHSVRYRRAQKAQPSHRSIPAGLHSFARDSVPHYLPQDWSAHIQSEGQLYFYNYKTRIVTEAYIYRPETLARIIYWSNVIESLIRSKSITLPNSSELFLQLEEEDCDGCSYYFVDHETRTEFWLEEIDTYALDIPETESASQLKWALETHYWTHVECFPMHTTGIPMSIVNELISILGHGRADHLTSSVGTFIYSASQCSEFLDLIRGHLSHSSETEKLCDGNMICVVSRIWSQVAHHRCICFYGEEHARLSRDQRMLDTPQIKTPRYISAIYKALFNVPGAYLKELDHLWVDELVYIEHWKQFMSRCLLEWKESTFWALLLFIIHTSFVTNSIGSRTVALVSMITSICGASAALALTHYLRTQSSLETGEVAMYLSKSNHPTLGFQPLAIVYSLPRSLVFWSAGLVAVQTYIFVLRMSDCYTAGALLCVLALGVVMVATILRKGTSEPSDTFERDMSNERMWWRRLFHSSTTSGDVERGVDDAPLLPVYSPHAT